MTSGRGQILVDIKLQHLAGTGGLKNHTALPHMRPPMSARRHLGSRPLVQVYA